jgi:tetratricopeptide (TPR) repeat protein
MNTTSNKLEVVAQEVHEYFKDISKITVTPGEGSAPDKYTILYQVQGLCRDNDGEVYNCDEHSITLSLPFGFPHFPPNCIPESLTFHPDFDSSAICIGDTWEADKSIVTLILHIATMISGESYSKTNAFNEEAAEWYRDNSDQLPLEITNFDKNESDAPTPAATDTPALSSTPAAPVIEESTELSGIDTLGDDDFGEAFSLGQEAAPNRGVDTDRLRVIAKQKRFQALSRELQSIDESFPGREELEAQTQSALDQAQSMFQEADDLELEGKQKEALAKFNSVESLVSDYPMLQQAIDRVQQASDLLGDWASDETPDQESSDTADTTEEETDTADQSGDRTFFEDKKAVGKKSMLIALGVGSIAMIITLIVTYLSLGSSLGKAEIRFEECQDLLDKDHFTRAEKKCTEALSLNAEVQMVKQGEKQALARKIRRVLTSAKMTQGLIGKTMYDGKYVSQSTKEIMMAFKEARQSGNTFFKKEAWGEAAASFTKALELARKTDTIKARVLADIRAKLPRAQFNSLMKAGERSLAISDWDGAKEHFGHALTLAKANPSVLPEDITELELLSNQATFNTLRDNAESAFDKGEWQTALENYDMAQNLVEKLGLSESDTISNLHENIAKTQIYMTIEKGKRAFAASDWDEAISRYEKAITLLEENSKILSRINTEESRGKLSRIMLHAEIIKNKQDVAKHLKSEDYTAVIKNLEIIKKSISGSPFASQDEFKTITKEVTEQIADARKQLLLIDKSSYLTENFKELFLKHYPAATLSVLSDPAVEYLKNIGEQILFRMQCTETAGGRPLRLQMDYLYNPSSNSWSFYSEQ